MVHTAAGACAVAPMNRRPRATPELPHERVTRRPSGQIRTDGHSERQRGKHECALAEAAAADQERVEPGLEEVVDVDVEQNAPASPARTGARLKGGAPREARGPASVRCRGAPAGRARVPASPRASRGTTHTRPPPRPRPATPNTRERHPPAVAHLDRHHQQRCDGAPELAGHQGSRPTWSPAVPAETIAPPTIEAFGNAPASPAPNRNRDEEQRVVAGDRAGEGS